MSAITKPMLAERCEDLSALKFPVLATPKLDGIRCLVISGKALSRKFKEIPNRHIQALVSKLPDGLTRFEEQESDRIPEASLARKGIFTRTGIDYSGDLIPVPLRYVHRRYVLSDHGIHPETGQYIFEYREQP